MSHPTRSRWRRVSFALTALLVAVFVSAVPSPAHASGTLRVHADTRGIDIGFALDPGRLNESAYRTIADSEFNLVVAENAMKWDATEPNRNQFTWSNADAVANYATSNNKRLYGHTLVWHSQLPGWVNNISTSSELLTVMRSHINAVAGRYAGKVTAWDVVNEAFEDNGSRRQSVFQQRIGDGYIAEAFRAARAADPTAKLCINDYSTDGINSKSTAIYNLVSSFKQQGVPIDCVGFQAHLIIGQVPSTFQQNLQRFADLGVDVRITELDIRMQTPADATKLAQQANDYRTVVQACLNVTRCRGVTVWGITDRYSWIPDVFNGQGAALLWDNNYGKKPAYTTVHDTLAGNTGGDSTPPTTPGTPSASGVTQNSVNLSWTASTDNVGVAGYNVVRVQGSTETVVATPSTNSAAVTGLTPSTQYTFAVYARDAAGNRSARSGTVNVTTSSGPGGGSSCRVSYGANSWNTGFTANLTITNTGSQTISGWSLVFSFGAGQTVVQPGWNASYAQSGAQVTATNLSYNGTIPASGSTSIGFNGNHNGNNPNPTAFTLNGATCTVG